MPGVHERLGFSGNWIYCAAAPNRSEGLPDKTSYSADWGTQSHTLLENALMEGVSPVNIHNRDLAKLAEFT